LATEVLGHPNDRIDVTDLCVTTRPQPGSANLTRIYCAGIFIGRITGQSVYDCTGRLRSGDDFARFVRAAMPR
jgi:hypothetical protein